MIDASLRPRAVSTASTIAAPAGDDGEGLVRVGMASLLALHHGAEAFALQPHRVRAAGSGGYVSPFKGRGMEFDEVRPYTRGDDARSIDWRVTARTGRPHTKLFREERERAVLLWIDLRAAMFFGTRGTFKAVRAAQCAALLGWNALHHGDRLGALIFDELHHEELRPKRGQPPFMHVLRRLTSHPAWERPERHGDTAAALEQALVRLRRVAQPGSLIIMLSDFAGLDGRGAAQLAPLARHNDMLAVAIHDPLEAELPPTGRYRVSDGTRSISVETGDPRRRDQYHRRFTQHRAELQQCCRRHGIKLIPLSTAEEPQAVLQRGLGKRR
jgi:uncharacterized protein (DUF58 family)